MKKNIAADILKKFLVLVLSVALLSVVVFFISRLAPGDPLYSYYGDRVEKMSAEEREWAENKLGLNDPIAVQYVRWFKNALKGDFGMSYKYKMPVDAVVVQRLGNTFILVGIGYTAIFIFSLLLGLFCAAHEDKWQDKLLCKVGTFTSCVPEFWMSLILILVFSVTLKWLPASGAYSVGNKSDIADRALHLILPLTAVVLGELGSDYVLLAKAKGLGRKSVLFRHCLRNAMPSYLSLMAIALPHVLGGTYIIEAVFSYPGLGTLAYESARYKDYNLLMLLCLMSGALVILCNMIAQSINEKLDPRFRAENILKKAEVQDDEQRV